MVCDRERLKLLWYVIEGGLNSLYSPEIIYLAIHCKGIMDAVSIVRNPAPD
jgi:hypothetical protein